MLQNERDAVLPTLRYRPSVGKLTMALEARIMDVREDVNDVEPTRSGECLFR